MESDTDPEREAYDECLSIVETILDYDPHSLQEEQSDEYEDVCGGDRFWYGDDKRGDFGEECERNEGDSDDDADASCGYSSDFGE